MSLSKIAEKIQRRLDKRPLEHSLKFDCGTDGHLTLSHDQARLTDGDSDCTIKISLANLEKLIAGKLNPATAFATGKIKVSGDMAVALKLGKLLG